MKRFAAILLATLGLAFAGIANATPIKWTLSGATLSDSSTLSGSFFYDAATNAYSGWDLSVTAGSLSAFEYTPSDSSVFGLSSSSLLWLFTSGHALTLNFIAPLTASGGTVALDLATAYTGNIYKGSWQSNNSQNVAYAWLTAGVVTTARDTSTSVPEPSSLALLGLALTGLGLIRRRRA